MTQAAQCSEIIKQVNNRINDINDHKGLFTDSIGKTNGVRSRGIFFCMDRAWASCKGVSYDKNEVAKSINTAFQDVDLTHLTVTKEELNQFQKNLGTLNKKFKAGKGFEQSLSTVIDTVAKHVLQNKKTYQGPTNQGSSVPVASQKPKPKRRHTATPANVGGEGAARSAFRKPIQAHTPHVASRGVAVSGKREECRAFLAFYRNEEKGKNGFMMDHILTRFREADLERHHNFIQWIFPTYQQSKFCRNAPLLNSDIVKAFETDRNLQLKQKQALILMLDHYGLQIDPHTDKISTNPINFAAKQKNFFINGSHNLLRITRILSSLISLGQPKLAVEFYTCLDMLSKGPIPRLKSSVGHYWKPVVRGLL